MAGVQKGREGNLNTRPSAREKGGEESVPLPSFSRTLKGFSRTKNIPSLPFRMSATAFPGPCSRLSCHAPLLLVAWRDKMALIKSNWLAILFVRDMLWMQNLSLQLQGNPFFLGLPCISSDCRSFPKSIICSQSRGRDIIFHFNDKKISAEEVTAFKIFNPIRKWKRFNQIVLKRHDSFRSRTASWQDHYQKRIRSRGLKSHLVKFILIS